MGLPGETEIDAAPLLAQAGNILLSAPGAALFFGWHEPGLYEIHVNFLPEYRGTYALETCRLACQWMFTKTDCLRLLTKVPAANRMAGKICGAMGATREFEMGGISFWSFGYDEWLRKTASIGEVGRQFQALIRKQLGLDDQAIRADSHDRALGALAEMLRGGQPEKAVALYNQWARFVGYGLVGLRAKSPLLVDIGDALLKIREDGSPEVVGCR